jgi:hypothetical protein
MRFLYLDPALRDDVGHHANFCRYIVGELRARGIETLVFGRLTVAPALQAELAVVPRFRYHTYAQVDPDPFAGWLIGFDDIARTTLDDLRELPPTDASDVVYVSSIRPPQLMALLEWRKDLSPDRRPAIVVESVGTGMTVQRERDRLIATIPNQQVDGRATLFRYVAHRLPREPDARFYVVTFGDVPTEMFKKILSYPAHTLPLPYPAVIPLRSRAGARPATVAILGHQVINKGYGRLPEIVQELLRVRSDFRLLLQVVDPLGPLETLERLREIAANNKRIRLEEKPAGKHGWPTLLEASDLILCPYLPDYYFAGLSTVACEAIANGIPLVVPAGTTIETLVAQCGGAGAAFDRFEPASIATATAHVLDRFDRFAALAHTAALRWPETRGPARMVDRLMSLIGSSNLRG